MPPSPPVPPRLEAQQRRTELTSLGATHVSALLAFRGQAAGGRLGGCNIGSLGAGAKVQLHSRPGPLCAPTVLPSHLPSHPVPVVVPPSPEPNDQYPASQRPTLAAFQAPNVRVLDYEEQSALLRASPSRAGLGASRAGKSGRGAWSLRAEGDIFLYEPYSPQPHQTKIKTYRTSLAH